MLAPIVDRVNRRMALTSQQMRFLISVLPLMSVAAAVVMWCVVTALSWVPFPPILWEYLDDPRFALRTYDTSDGHVAVYQLLSADRSGARPIIVVVSPDLEAVNAR